LKIFSSSDGLSVQPARASWAGFPGAADDRDHLPMPVLIGFRAADADAQDFVGFNMAGSQIGFGNCGYRKQSRGSHRGF
jgi:hypothetical protein